MTGRMNCRILLVDDMPTIHDDFRKVLSVHEGSADIADDEMLLFGKAETTAVLPFEMDSAFQGEEAVAMVKIALQKQKPYAMAFVDMRMPPGIDGAETIEHLWQEDPELQVVICTAHSDYEWQNLMRRLDPRDRLLVLKKPFEAIEVLQLATTLVTKRHLGVQATLKMADLAVEVENRTRDLRQANDALTAEIEERKRLEEQLVQSAKMACIGQLAAGVAHEINNPIAFVASNLNTLAQYLDALMSLAVAYESAEIHVESADVADRLQSLRDQLEFDRIRDDIPPLIKETVEGVIRVRDIVRDLRSFAGAGPSMPWQLVDIREALDSAIEISVSDQASVVDVKREYGPLGEIECLPSLLSQVFLGLLKNAVDACATKGGTVTVRAGAEGGHVWIDIADTGCGISAENLTRLFEPFFTTKPVGKGMGLGLSLAYGIVQSHGGTVHATSELAKGSTFHLRLPIRQRSVQP